VPNTDREGVDSPALYKVLLAAREAGFLGPGPIDRHLLHAEGFVDLAQARMPQVVHPRILDLGSGGGLPGLVVAQQWPAARLVLLEANQRRAQFLERAVRACDLEGRVEVVQERAEIAGRDVRYRAAFDGVVVRSFGPPAVVAECAAPLLLVGGWLIVSEPPSEGDGEQPVGDIAGVSDDSGRWPADRLRPFGLEPVAFVRNQFGYEVLRQRQVCPERFPRRNGMPSKKPLF
jgi:16S rRNA (guanine527-N7)-methyltransferase